MSPAPKADRIALEEFLTVATRAVIAALNPQPLPPGPDDVRSEVALNPQPEPPSDDRLRLNPQPLPPGIGAITVGIVFTPQDITVEAGPAAER